MPSDLYRDAFKETPAGDVANNFNVEGELNSGVIDSVVFLPHKHSTLENELIILGQYMQPGIPF